MKENVSQGRFDRLKRSFMIVVLDMLAISVSYFFGLWLRYDFRFAAIPETYITGFMSGIGIWALVHVAVFACFGLYSSIWAFVSTSEMFRILWSYAVLGVISAVAHGALEQMIPRSGMIMMF